MGNSSPDMIEYADMQGDANADVIDQQTFGNRPTQYTPWGYTKWTSEMVDGNRHWTQTQGLTPELQEILNKQVAMQGGRTDLGGMVLGRMGSEYSDPMDYSGLNPWAETPQAQYTLPEGPVDDPYGTRNRAENAMYDSAMSRIAPSQQSERQALEIKMRN